VTVLLIFLYTVYIKLLVQSIPVKHTTAAFECAPSYEKFEPWTSSHITRHLLRYSANLLISADSAKTGWPAQAQHRAESHLLFCDVIMAGTE